MNIVTDESSAVSCMLNSVIILLFSEVLYVRMISVILVSLLSPCSVVNRRYSKAVLLAYHNLTGLMIFINCQIQL